MKRSLVVSIAIAAAVISASPMVLAADAAKPVSKLDALFEDKVVAKGKSFEIKENQLDSGFAEFLAAAAAQGQQVPENLRNGMRYRILEKLIASKTASARANADDHKAAAAKAEQVLAQTTQMLGSAEALEQRLKTTGQTVSSFMTNTYNQNLIQTVLERLLRPTAAVVTDAQVKEFYDRNPARFERPETVKAKHILISAMDRQSNTALPEPKRKEKLEMARRIQERVVKGEDFDALVKEFSDDGASKVRNGEYAFARGQLPAASKAFESAAFSMKPGQISDLVETPYGFHIVKLIEKTPSEKIAFDKVAKDIKEGLSGVELQKQIPAFLARIQKEDGVEILVPMPPELKAEMEAAAKAEAAAPGVK